MSYFAYKAVDASGTEREGFLEAMDAGTVYGDLYEKGLYVVSIRQSSKLIADIRHAFHARRVRRLHLIEFANNLSIMLTAGIPLLTALGDIGTTIDDPFFQGIVANLKHSVEEGASFSDALAMHPGIFPDVFVRIVRIGEETGRLERSLSDVATHLQKMEDLAQAIKRALIYPSFAILTTMGALVFWLAYVLPKVLTTFREMKVELPLITRMLIVVSDFMQHFWFLVPLVPVGIFFVIKGLQRNPRTKYVVDRAKLRMPIARLVTYNKLLALFCEQLRILIVAGITIDRCLVIVGDVIGNEVFRRAIAAVKEEVSFGTRISDALRRHAIFPPLLVRMVDIGESTGNLDEQFTFLSNYYLKKLDDISEKIGKMVEPIVIVVIGILFAIIIVGLLLPIYDLISKVGKM